MLTSIIVIAAVIMYRTATESIHVKVNKVDMASVVLSGSDDLGGIEAGGYASLDYRITNESTSSAYVFIRFEMNTQGLYEVCSPNSTGEGVNGGNVASPECWVEMSDLEEPGQLIFAYGEAGAMRPVGVGEEVELAGRLHCLASAEEYSMLDGADMDFDVYGCLIYGLSEDGSSVGYNTSAESLYQAYNEEDGKSHMFIDLHTHTTASDGQYSSIQLVEMAQKWGLKLLSITDHDTVAGISSVQSRAEELRLDFIPGIEISCQDVEEIHILGYGIESSNPELISSCNIWSQARRDRGILIRNYLSALGIDVDLDVVKSYAGDGNLGRPHFARYLVETGVVENRKSAFDIYLDTEEFKAATDRKKPEIATAIELIHKAGGKAVLAHPGNYKNIDIAELIQRLVECGLDGIECFYSRHSESQTQEYLEMAKRYGLKTGCGSDFHGEKVKPDIRLGMELEEQYRELLVV